MFSIQFILLIKLEELGERDNIPWNTQTIKTDSRRNKNF